MRKNKYRIVEDMGFGYCVQIKRWWFPVWLKISLTSCSCIDTAKEYIQKHKGAVVYVEN